MDDPKAGDTTGNATAPDRWFRTIQFIVAAGAGAGLGAGAAWYWSHGGLEKVGGTIIAFITVVIGGLFLVAGLVLRDRGRREDGAGLMVMAAGIALGFAVIQPLAEPLQLTYHERDVREARGPARLELPGVEGFQPATGAEVACDLPGMDPSIVYVYSTTLGTLSLDGGAGSWAITISAKGRTNVMLGQEAGSAAVEVETSRAEGTKPDGGGPPQWAGGGYVNVTDGSGTIQLTNIKLRRPEGGLPPGWPATISGTFTWTCGDWISR